MSVPDVVPTAAELPRQMFLPAIFCFSSVLFELFCETGNRTAMLTVNIAISIAAEIVMKNENESPV